MPLTQSTKVWRHKNEISEIMGFVRIFWKNNVQEAYLPKMSISGQIVSEIVAQLSLENSIQTLLIFWGVEPKKCSFLASTRGIWCLKVPITKTISEDKNTLPYKYQTVNTHYLRFVVGTLTDTIRSYMSFRACRRFSPKTTTLLQYVVM